MLHNAIVLYRSTITFSYIVSTNHKSRLHIPTERLFACAAHAARALSPKARVALAPALASPAAAGRLVSGLASALSQAAADIVRAHLAPAAAAALTTPDEHAMWLHLADEAQAFDTTIASLGGRPPQPRPSDWPRHRITECV